MVSHKSIAILYNIMGSRHSAKVANLEIDMESTLEQTRLREHRLSLGGQL